MFFLLRMAFWLGLVLVLLPRDKAPETDKGPQVSATEAVLAATAAVSDMSQFCARQPAACAVGGQAASVVGERAQAGAKKVYDFFTERNEKNDKVEKTDGAEKPQAAQEKASDKVQDKQPKKGKHSAIERKNPDHTGSIDESDAAPFPDTLSQDDLMIAWQGPQI
ncbi:DUF5330 domain-containing protein [Afipia felis]|uniref:Uncharacterized protein n=2 Tax=Afipia felis TaxID=1035 RepID=A0A380W939_AFIFE|nr:DUF5330 domain-containing protein [Afipia felis]EKS28726.1 hypothetical protein HMPREF9697_01254 [Afipia felis ATCC 53690]SUU77433.1 Uncharacterised protein [Afipia felis]SUU85500.1 Uncharacterised protein [Afipia felis]